MEPIADIRDETTCGPSNRQIGPCIDAIVGSSPLRGLYPVDQLLIIS
jgi:hypothetical protein